MVAPKMLVGIKSHHGMAQRKADGDFMPAIILQAKPFSSGIA